MLTTRKSYAKSSKTNRKKKDKPLPSDGEEHHKIQDKRFPIIALPEIITSPRYQIYRRFVNNGGAVSGNMQISDLLNQFLVAVTSVLAYTYVRALRIKKIRFLCPVQTQGTSVQIRLQPLGADTSNNSFNAVPETFLDTSASIDVPAYISLSPSIDTPLGSWHYNSTVSQTLLQMTVPQGTTMDILFEYILSAESGASAYTATIAAGVVGTLYTRNILTNFVPANLNVI